MTSRPQIASGPGLGSPWGILASLVLAEFGCYAATCLASAPPGAHIAAALARGPTLSAVVSLGAKVDAWVAAGSVQRLVLAAFLHVGAPHLLANLFGLVLLGVVLGPRIGGPALFAVWILTATGGESVSFATDAGPSVGASGAIFGLAGVLLVVLVTAWRGLTRRERWRLGAPLALLILIALFEPLMRAHVDVSAHLGGLALGLALGGILVRWPRAAPGLAVLAALVLLSAAGLQLLHPGLPPADARVAALAGPGDLALPLLGRHGRLVATRCERDASPGAPACVGRGWEMLAVAGRIRAALAASPALAEHLPPAGRCLHYTDAEEAGLVIRTDARHVIVLATVRPAWARYAALRRRLSTGRCPGR